MTNPTTNIILNGKKKESISSKIKNKPRMFTLASFIQHNFGNPTHGYLIRKNKQTNKQVTQIGKEGQEYQ